MMLVNDKLHSGLRVGTPGLALLLAGCGIALLSAPAHGGDSVRPTELYSHTNQDEFHHPIDPIDTGHLIPGGLLPEPRYFDVDPSPDSLDITDGSEPQGLTGFAAPNVNDFGFDFDAVAGFDFSAPGEMPAFAIVGASPSVRSFLSPAFTMPDLALTQSARTVSTGGGLTSPIPAPGVLAILALAGGLAGRRRRRPA